MKFYTYLNENVDINQLAQTIAKDCQPFFKELEKRKKELYNNL